MTKIKIPKTVVAWLLVVSFAFFIFFLSAIPDLKSSLDEVLDIILRKIAHATEFGLLAYLIFSALEIHKINYKKAIFLASIFALLYALSDEYHQSFVPGREMALVDFLIDATGVLMAFFLLLFSKKRKNLN
jgi:VanZ family protein